MNCTPASIYVLSLPCASARTSCIRLANSAGVLKVNEMRAVRYIRAVPTLRCNQAVAFPASDCSRQLKALAGVPKSNSMNCTPCGTSVLSLPCATVRQSFIRSARSAGVLKVDELHTLWHIRAVPALHHSEASIHQALAADAAD